MPLEGLSLGLFKFADCKIKMTLELAGWWIEACIGLSKLVSSSVGVWGLEADLVIWRCEVRCKLWFTPSHRMKCAKANLVDAAFIESLQTAIKPANCHSWVMEQSGLIVEQVSSHRNAPPRQFLHVFTKTFAVTLAICGWNPPRSCHLEPRALPHRTGKYKAFPNARFFACKTLMRITSTQIQLHARKKDHASPPWANSDT